MKFPKPLFEDIFYGKCLPFAGAGFSINAKSLKEPMPDWNTLSEKLIEIGNLSTKKDSLKIASEFEKKYGRVQLIETIRRSLLIDDIEPGLAHKAFSELPFDTIYTTNFDLLLEDSFSLIKKPYRSLVGELQIPFYGGPLTTNIIKMHGDLRHEEHIIITKEDYDKYLNQYPVIATHLSAMLITRTALFIGYSLSDPDFQHIRNVVRSRLGKFERMAYVVQFNQTEGQIEKAFNDNIHIINITTHKNESKDNKLEGFFREIQSYVDFKQGKKIRLTKPELFEKVSEKAFERSAKSGDSETLFTSTSNFCFVLMPFSQTFDYTYREIIKPTVTMNGIEVIRADEMFSPGSIMEQIRASIQQSRFCIADLTGRNSNVLYELGIAQTMNKPTILLTQDIKDVPFDLASYRFIVYNTKNNRSIEIAKRQLDQAIQQVLGVDRLKEARELLDKGMTRAAVAMLGILFEHSLKKLLSSSNISTDINSSQILDKKSTGQILSQLIDLAVIKKEDVKDLRYIISLRNKAVHDLKEPKKSEAEIMYSEIYKFIKEYLHNT